MGRQRPLLLWRPRTSSEIHAVGEREVGASTRFAFSFGTIRTLTATLELGERINSPCSAQGLFDCGGDSVTECCQTWDGRRVRADRRFTGQIGRSHRVWHVCTCDSGSARISKWGWKLPRSGASHRTHWQSEESALRHRRAPQTTSQRLRRASWALHRGVPCSSDTADAAFTDVWRAGRYSGQFDRLLLQYSTPQVAPSMMSV